MGKAEWSKEALDTFSQISTFLAGIFFACLLILVQQQEKFQYSITIVKWELQAIEVISIPLTITFLAFLFAALVFADACASGKRKTENCALAFAACGFVGLFVSMFFVLLQISLAIAILGIAVALILFLVWATQS